MSGTRVASGRRRAVMLIVLALLAIAVAMLRFSIGRLWTGEGWRLEFGWPDHAVAGFRMNALAVASTVGASLAISGLFLQGLLRNPLASPFVLGLSSGATLGLAIAMWLAIAFGFSPFVGFGSVVPAFLGAMATLAVVALAGRRRGGLDPITLVLAGVVVSSVCGALLMLVHHLLPPGTRGDLVAWTMGRIDEQPDPRLLAGAAAILALSVAIAWINARSLDVALLGDEEARSVGLSIVSLRWALLVGAGVLAASAVPTAARLALFVSPPVTSVSPARMALRTGGSGASSSTKVQTDSPPTSPSHSQPGSTAQSSSQPSPPSRFSSSQPSSPAQRPSPHSVAQTDAAAPAGTVQVQPTST